MATVDVTQENFEQVVGGHDIVIVDFSAAIPDAALPLPSRDGVMPREGLDGPERPPSLESWAPWCGPCRGFAPVYETASEKCPDVVFASAAVPATR